MNAPEPLFIRPPRRHCATAMRRFVLLLVLGALAACGLEGGDRAGSGSGTAAPAQPASAGANSHAGEGAGEAVSVITPNAQVPDDCPLVIGFASYAMGIDSAVRQAVEALLARDSGVNRIEHFAWGREGEVSICARTRGE